MRNIRSRSPARSQRTSSSPSNMSARSTRGNISMSVHWRTGISSAIRIKEGQPVKEGDVLFETLPVLYKAEWEAAVAEKDLAQLELNYTKTLAKKGVSENEVALYKAKLAKAQAKLELAEAELNFAKVKAPFDGIVDRQHSSSAAWSRRGTSSRPCPITA